MTTFGYVKLYSRTPMGSIMRFLKYVRIEFIQEIHDQVEAIDIDDNVGVYYRVKYKFDQRDVIFYIDEETMKKLTEMKNESN
jgi:hypothetical protein